MVRTKPIPERLLKAIGSSRFIGKGNCREISGNRNWNTATDSENSARLLVLFLETDIVGNQIVRKGDRQWTACLRQFYQSVIWRTGKSREIISDGEDKADSGKREEGCRTSPIDIDPIEIGQGSCKETVGNNSRKQWPVRRNSGNARLFSTVQEPERQDRKIMQDRYTEDLELLLPVRFRSDRKKPRNYQQW